ncbi:hypothetical protein SAMN04488570_0307 [Nocardioides scoriae]|uniref:Uncharacterized protein n=1 Tax=Nocardioides scoriae TaxID=642780 RepID=A0A1H1LPB7_9ACTN|nr:hypothetical protein [Nocardioides scoriae]SDR76444.1 hypothetical protein SAMN04488570_0307 [Nocardioides scoriae]
MNRVYDPADRSEIQVLIEGTWYEGDLHAWQARGDEQWASVSYSRDHQNYVDTVPADPGSVTLNVYADVIPEDDTSAVDSFARAVWGA